MLRKVQLKKVKSFLDRRLKRVRKLSKHRAQIFFSEVNTTTKE